MTRGTGDAWDLREVSSGAPAGRSLELDGALLVEGRFERDGADLVITGDGAPPLIFAEYFADGSPVDLVTSSGEIVRGELVAALAGPRAPAQYAQAGEAAAAGTPIGEVEALAGTVTATRADGTEVTLSPGMPVFQGDVIQTGPEGKLSLVFADGTEFSLSPAARMVLDELVYDPSADSGSLLLSVLRGAFVFITGQIAGTGPGAMEVTTPAGVLGIRGTQVGCTIGAEDGATACALLVEADGHVGEVTFINDISSILLTKPYETVIAESRASTLATRQLDLAEIRSLLAGALGEGGLPEAEAGLLEKTGPATFDELSFGFLGTAGSLFTPLGPLADVAGPDDVVLEGRAQVPFMLQPLEDPDPGPRPAPPTEIRAGQSTVALPLQVTVLEQDFGDLVDFPVIPDGTNAFQTRIFADQGLALFGDPRSLTFANGADSATVTLVNDGGRFQNTLGAYVIGPDGRINPPELVFANASVEGGGGDLVAGESSVVLDNQGRGFAPGSTLSLVILADGFRQNPVLQQVDPADLRLRFEEAAPGGLFPGMPDVADDGLQLFALVPGADPILLDGALFHTAAHFEGLPLDGQLVATRGLNDDLPTAAVLPRDENGQPINQHYFAGTDGARQLRLGFEDLLFDRSDFDFEDLVLDVRIEPEVSPSVTPQPFGFDFDLANTSSDLSELRIAIGTARSGDRFSLGDGFTLAPGGAVLRAGEATGVRLEQQGDTAWRFSSAEPASIGVYEDILNAVGLVTDLERPTAGTRIVDIEVVDPSGIESSLQVRFIVPGLPLLGSTRADELTGSASNDAIFGLDGDDILSGRGGDDLVVGGPGSDTLSGGAGTDLFRIDRLADIDADGDGRVDFIDQILDFNPADGDLVDLSGLLGEFDGPPADLVNVQEVDNGGAIEVQVDLGGLSGAAVDGFQPIVRLLATGDIAEIETAIILPA